MDDLSLNAIADGIYRYLAEKTETPLDGIAVLGITLCLIHHASASAEPFASFAQSFHDSLIDTHRSASAEGPERMQ